MKRLLLLMTAIATVTAAREEVYVDGSGIATFWELHDTLAADRDVSPEAWKHLFTTPGYRQLEEEEGRSRWMLPLLELAYRPSRAAEAQALKAGGDMRGTFFLPHLELAARERKKIDAFVAEAPVAEWMTEGARLARSYLPSGTAEDQALPDVYLVVLDPDGKALDGCIVVDALLCLHMRRPEAFFAHELHHVFRDSLDRLENDAAPEELRVLFKILENLETEGVADLLDKREDALARTELTEKEMQHPVLPMMRGMYLEMLDEAAVLIAELDAALSTVASDPRTAADQGAALQPRFSRLSGRPVGMWMAHTIEQELGRRALIETVGDPFGFAQTYARAAEAAEGTTLSRDSLGLLEAWRADYLRAAR